MVQVLASAKGEGKTKRLIEMANEEIKKAAGNIVFIDDDSRHIYDLNYNIRFIQSTDFPIGTKDAFLGFICGILARDRDIEMIYIDGLLNMVKSLRHDDLVEFTNNFAKLSETFDVNFVLSLNCKASELPEQIKHLFVA